ncbi:hypothetical protein DYB25_006636 [Aphanomyces astaci]|uniref:EF-hand domain-containing protein n=1 Tax=Aphanomyces astaci TaxID=112090 RepID=A0A397BTH0_APHAT|nr:hypothetical protein DYB25_006636 [Aphanomyces astaci]
MATAVEQARAIFDCVDTSKDGVIDQSELGKLLEALGEDPTPQNIVSALFQLDTGGDGTISFDEFVSFYKLNYLPRHPTKLLSSRYGPAGIGHAKSATYTLPPPTFCFGKALQRDKENAGQGVAFVLQQLKTQLQTRGLQAFQALSQHLHGGGGATSWTFPVFKSLALDTLHLSATEKDLRAVFAVFDTNGDGMIQAAEWARALETPLSGSRLELVTRAFESVDVHHTGAVSLSTLRRQFDGSALPEVESGVLTIDEVRSELLAAMTNLLTRDAAITWPEFAKHYTHVSSATSDDAAFTRVIGVGGWMALCGESTAISLAQDPSPTKNAPPPVKKLSLQAFKDTMKNAAGVVLSDKDWRVIFEWFAVNHTLDLRHVAKQLHTPLSSIRLGLVRRAFRSIDVDKLGRVSLVELVDRFDPTQHPSVLSGKATVEEVFDVLKMVFPGPMVTAHEFEVYYGCVSQAILEDAEFELHVTSVWASRFDDVRSESGRSTSVSSSTRGTDEPTKKSPLTLYHESQNRLAAALTSKPKNTTDKPKATGRTIRESPITLVSKASSKAATRGNTSRLKNAGGINHWNNSSRCATSPMSTTIKKAKSSKSSSIGKPMSTTASK